ncbi:MAG: sensor histidine kinase [Candidatus Promineifilaceae bacterium]
MRTLPGEGTLTAAEPISAELIETQRLASIGLLTASVAHELTNPISIITATCANLQRQIAEGSLAPDELGPYLEMIEVSAWRCARLMQSLRAHTYRNGSAAAPCKLNELIREALVLVSYQFEREHNIRIECQLAPDLAPIPADQGQITQVLINLLLNARDALAGRGGRIGLASWQVAGWGAQAFAVSDDGPGIEPAALERLFEPLFTTKPLGQGSGLGLAISAAIVERHGGRIEAANDPAGGARFTVSLPA